MILRKIVARSMQEALRRVEREVGQDALIVDSRSEHGRAVILAQRPDRTARVEPRKPFDSSQPRYPEGFRAVANQLLDFGLSKALVQILHDSIDGLHPQVMQKGDPSLPRIVARVLAGLVPSSKRDSRVTALVGPTGVGKTTTLAKLAARALLERKESIAIFSLDTYRIAAVEQLRAFADMMNAPFSVLFTPRDLRTALEEHRDKDRIFIDTTGRSPSDTQSLAAMRGFLTRTGELRAEDAVSVELCLTAGTRRRDLDRVCDAFAAFSADDLILTKWDETEAPGEALSLAIERGLPIRCLTNGQDVPKDILRVDSGKLAALALGHDELGQAKELLR